MRINLEHAGLVMDFFGGFAWFRLSGTIDSRSEVFRKGAEIVDEVGAVLSDGVLNSVVGAFKWLCEGEIACGNGMGEGESGEEKWEEEKHVGMMGMCNE